MHAHRYRSTKNKVEEAEKSSSSSKQKRITEAYQNVIKIKCSSEYSSDRNRNAILRIRSGTVVGWSNIQIIYTIFTHQRVCLWGVCCCPVNRSTSPKTKTKAKSVEPVCSCTGAENLPIGYEACLTVLGQPTTHSMLSSTEQPSNKHRTLYH